MNVRVVCEKCGEVSIPIADLNVRYCVDDGRTSYWFKCPSCLMVEASDVHPSKSAMLLSHPGVRSEPWFLPEEMHEAHDGPPISVDDCIAFREAMGAA